MSAAHGPPGMTVLPLGVGGAFTARYFHSSMLVSCGGATILIDAPSPLHRILAEAGHSAGMDLSIDRIDAIILTHLHGDHCNGLEEIGLWRRHVSGAPPPRLFALPEVAAVLWEHRLVAAMGRPGSTDRDAPRLADFFDLHPVEPGHSVEVTPGGPTLEVRRTCHFVPCCGFRLTGGGASLGYSGDTVFDQGLIDFLASCDLVVHESGSGEGHTPIANLLAQPAELRRRMRLIHYPDDFDASTSPIALLRQGIPEVVAKGSVGVPPAPGAEKASGNPGSWRGAGGTPTLR